MNKTITKSLSQNSFVLLCRMLSSIKVGCYSLSCSKCRDTIHIPWLKKLAMGLRPDLPEWGDLEYTRDDGYLAFNNNFSDVEVQRLVDVVSEAKLTEIHDTSHFPEWLGYLGWVIDTCRNDPSELKKLSTAVIPQLDALSNCEVHSPDTILTIQMLQEYEQDIKKRNSI